VLKQNKSWADQGHVVTREQFPFQVWFDKALSVKISKEIPSARMLPPPLQVEDDEGLVKVSSPFITICIIKANGSIMSLSCDGNEMLGKKGLQPSYTRATTDNDRGGKFLLRCNVGLFLLFYRLIIAKLLFYQGVELVFEHMNVSFLRYFEVSQHFSHYLNWKKHGLTQDDPPTTACQNTSIEVRDVCVVISTDSLVQMSSTRRTIFKQRMVYEIYQDGRIKVIHTVTPNKQLGRIPSLPRIGL
jgi:hypothetical protein